MISETDAWEKWELCTEAQTTRPLLDMGSPRRQRVLREWGLSEPGAKGCRSQPIFYEAEKASNRESASNNSHMFLSFSERLRILRRNPSFLCFLHHPICGLDKLVNVVLSLIDVPEHQPLILQVIGQMRWVRQTYCDMLSTSCFRYAAFCTEAINAFE